MEDKTQSITMNGLAYGAITAVVMIIYSLILYLLDLHMNDYLPIIGFLFLIGGLVYGTLEYRKKLPGGAMTYGKAFGTSFMIALFAVIIGAVYAYAFYQFIAPDAIVDLIDKARERALDSNPDITEEQLQAALDMQSAFFKPVWIAVSAFFMQLVVSAVICLIVSAFLKKEDKSFSVNS